MGRCGGGEVGRWEEWWIRDDDAVTTGDIL